MTIGIYCNCILGRNHLIELKNRLDFNITFRHCELVAANGYASANYLPLLEVITAVCVGFQRDLCACYGFFRVCCDCSVSIAVYCYRVLGWHRDIGWEVYIDKQYISCNSFHSFYIPNLTFGNCYIIFVEAFCKYIPVFCSNTVQCTVIFVLAVCSSFFKRRNAFLIQSLIYETSTNGYCLIRCICCRSKITNCCALSLFFDRQADLIDHIIPIGCRNLYIACRHGKGRCCACRIVDGHSSAVHHPLVKHLAFSRRICGDGDYSAVCRSCNLCTASDKCFAIVDCHVILNIFVGCLDGRRSRLCGNGGRGTVHIGNGRISGLQHPLVEHLSGFGCIRRDVHGSVCCIASAACSVYNR